MVRQTSLNNGVGEEGVAAIGRHMSRFARDLVTLTELQVQLLALDLREARRRSGAALLLVGGGALLALACLPVLLAALAWCLVDFAEWPRSAGFGLVGCGALLAAGLAGWLGWKRLTTAASTFSRSRDELQENIRWLKEVWKVEE